MDMSFIAAASSALTVAREISRASIAIRDFNAMAGTVSQLNDQILKAQDALFSHQSQLLAMQQELFQAQEKLRIAEKVIAERGNYELVELSQGVFVYRLKPPPSAGSGVSYHLHYLCQPCFDNGAKAVLYRRETGLGVSHSCPLCKISYQESSTPYRRHVKPDYNPYA